MIGIKIPMIGDHRVRERGVGEILLGVGQMTTIILGQKIIQGIFLAKIGIHGLEMHPIMARAKGFGREMGEKAKVRVWDLAREKARVLVGARVEMPPITPPSNNGKGRGGGAVGGRPTSPVPQGANVPPSSQ